MKHNQVTISRVKRGGERERAENNNYDTAKIDSVIIVYNAEKPIT